VLARHQVLVERLMHVPEDRDTRHNGFVAVLSASMRILDRYIVREVLWPSALGLLITTFLFIIPVSHAAHGIGIERSESDAPNHTCRDLATCAPPQLVAGHLYWTNEMTFPSGSRTWKSRPPHACLTSRWAKSRRRASYSWKSAFTFATSIVVRISDLVQRLGS
jgi:hypothetical protein